jgi:hypothetical protein
MPTLRSNLSAFVEDLTPFLNEVIGGGFTPWPAMAGKFLNQETMTSGWTDIGTRSTLGAFSVKDEIGQQAEDQYIIGPQMRVAAIEYAKQVPTSRIALEDSRSFDEASALLAGIAGDIRQRADDTKEILGHDLLNSTTGNLTPDGIDLYSAALHVNLQGDTFGNLRTAALSEASLELAMTQLKQMTDDRGFPIFQQGMTLIVPQELEFTAEKILGTDRAVGNNGAGTNMHQLNDINVMARAGLSIIVSPYLTDANDWFLQASNHGLNWYNRESLRNWNDVDDNRGIVTQGATFRSAIAASDPRGIIKSVVT